MENQLRRTAGQLEMPQDDTLSTPLVPKNALERRTQRRESSAQVRGECGSLPNSLQLHDGPMLDGPREEIIIGAGDERSLVEDVTSSRYLPICRILAAFPSGESVGTGVLVHPRLVLTVAHNIKNDREQASGITLDFGQEGSSSLLRVQPSQVFISDRFLRDGDFNRPETAAFDFAALVLPTGVTEISPLLPLQFSTEFLKVDETQIEVPGFPVQVSGNHANGDFLFTRRTIYRGFPQGISAMTHTGDTSGGNSGSPLLLDLPDGTWVAGLHSRGWPDAGINLAVPFLDDVSDEIKGWMATAGL